MKMNNLIAEMQKRANKISKIADSRIKDIQEQDLAALKDSDWQLYRYWTTIGSQLSVWSGFKDHLLYFINCNCHDFIFLKYFTAYYIPYFFLWCCVGVGKINSLM